jgi:hypothetical protein
MTTGITGRRRNSKGYFTVRWSRIQKADRHSIRSSVPSQAGIYELYAMDERNGLQRVRVGEAWYGGVRHTLRELCDPKTPQGRDLARDRVGDNLFFRYALSDSHADMQDVVFFLTSDARHGERRPDDSGRFHHIYLKEISPDKLIDV